MKFFNMNKITSFGQKRFIDKQSHNYLKGLLTKMNEQSVYVENENNFKSSFLKKLQVDSFTLTDGRCLIKRVPEEQQMQKETMLDVGKVQVVINNKNGEIIDYYKPVMTSWNKILNNISKYMKILSENFDNLDIVKRTRLNLNGLTETGLEKQKRLDEEFKKLESKIVKK